MAHIQREPTLSSAGYSWLPHTAKYSGISESNVKTMERFGGEKLMKPTQLRWEKMSSWEVEQKII